MIRIRENVIIIILNTRKIELVEQGKCVLQVHIIVCDTVHDEEADIARKSGRVGYGSVEIAVGVVLRCVHVALGIDRVCSSGQGGE